MNFKRRTLNQIADMICGNFQENESFFPYRSSKYLTEFFEDADTDFVHDGTTRASWVADTLVKILSEPTPSSNIVPDSFTRVIDRLMDPTEATNEDENRSSALRQLNAALAREGYEAFYGEDKKCYLRHIKTNTIAAIGPNPHRPFSAAEQERRNQLESYLNTCSEDDLIEEILLPCFDSWAFTA